MQDCLRNDNNCWNTSRSCVKQPGDGMQFRETETLSNKWMLYATVCYKAVSQAETARFI